jgi:hypothetical protein
MQTLKFSRKLFSLEIILILFFAYRTLYRHHFQMKVKSLKCYKHSNLIKFTGFIVVE